MEFPERTFFLNPFPTDGKLFFAEALQRFFDLLGPAFGSCPL